MNIEDKYKTHFKTHKSILVPELWKEISTRLDEKPQTKTYRLVAAACLLIGIAIYSYETVKIEYREVALTTALPKISFPIITAPQVTLSKGVTANKLDLKILKKTIETKILLKEIGLNRIYNPPKIKVIKYTKKTFVQLKIKAPTLTKSKRRKFDNPAEKLIDLVKLIVKKESQKIEIPSIEIDYKSLLTLNDNK